jgi:ubiquinone/menaquinone biosynthesis C-methylase UbiE
MNEFDDRYSRFGDGVVAAVETEVIGVPGANGYTTVEQARDLAEALHLGPDIRVLDIGSGAGWPALYLISETGCEAVLTDPSPDGVRAAAGQAVDVDSERRSAFALASGVALPFKSRSFDAVMHADTLC